MKVLVLLSGGIDSAVCLALAVKKYGKENVSTITFNYGQKNVQELKSCKKIAKYYEVENNIVDISNIFTSTSCSLLKSSKKEIPKISYNEQYKEDKKTSMNVPFRNGIMLSICAGYALDKKASVIYYGIHKEEGVAELLYPDCGEDFNLSMNLAIFIGSGKEVQIEAPLAVMYKKDIIKLGKKLKVPFELTWTCYESGNKSCGKCCACVDRLKGFKENKMEDPIEYEAI